MKREIITAKVPKQKRRADFLFHDGQFKPKSVQSKVLYNRKKLGKNDIDTNWKDC
jgi:hypothetical protein